MAETAETYVSGPWLQAPSTRAVIAALGPENARFVGGAVRDALLGRPVSDIDIATPLSPENVIKRLRDAGLKAVPTGIDHGTITAIADHTPFEVTTLRYDVEHFGRHARVAFTEDWKADAARRDFTMNALYADEEGRVHDYFGGIGDARAGHVRFIGDARERIEEDALRILRFFRFYAHYGHGPLDEPAMAACIEKANLICVLSVERVREELLKLMRATDPLPAAQAMARTSILSHTLPEFDADEGIARLARLVHYEQELGLADGLRRLVALAHPDCLEALAPHLKLSKRQRIRLKNMATPLAYTTDNALKESIYRHGGEAACDRLIFQSANTGTAIEKLKGQLDTLSNWTCPSFPIKGKDLLDMGLVTGPKLGALLKTLEDEWIASGFRMDKAELIERAHIIQGDKNPANGTRKGHDAAT